MVTGGLRLLTTLAVLVPVGLVGCDRVPAPRSAPTPDAVAPAPAAVPPELTVTPTDGTTGATLSTEIGTGVTGGEITRVTLTAAGGTAVAGRMRADGTSWVPDRPLAPATGYTATVTATGAAGRSTTAGTSFTTMAAPGARTGTGLYLRSGQEYGVAMPVAVEFVEPVPERYRAGVQRRMFVTTRPPQPGVWHWVADGGQAFYRGPRHWQPGTAIEVRIALDGHPTGEDRYGDTDRVATATIGSALSIEIDNASKRMTVSGDEVATRTMPVSLGKPSTPSSYGRMVVMSREARTVFDTYAELGPAGYRVEVAYALRLTWRGEFIHAAPWSVADQGVRNVSHGCVNMSTADAAWLYEVVKVGDPVTVTGTERRLEPGNGWTAWELTWEEFAAGSALPVPDDPASAAAATALAPG
jgi:lipoprotein-anchoring transpeptidase ErfK/SrfK